jgi:hypothetical protein
MKVGTGDMSCKHEEKQYAAGSELCVEDKCMICKDGEWKDKISGMSAFYPAAGTRKPLE